MWVPGIVAAMVALLVTALAVPAAIRLATVLGAIDIPGGRKQHREPVPRLGGVATLLGICAGVGVVAPFRWSSIFVNTPIGELALFGGSVIVIFLVGLLDDVRRVPVSLKLLLETLVAALLVHTGWSFTIHGARPPA